MTGRHPGGVQDDRQRREFAIVGTTPDARPCLGHSFTGCGSVVGREPLEHGLELPLPRRNNRAMRNKPSPRYAWDEEPVDEGPSAFGPTTSHATLSGYHPMNDPARQAAPRGGLGAKSVVAFCVALLALGGWSIATLVPLLRH